MASDAQVAIVTGASAGIGRAAAQRLRRDGYRLALAARSAERLNQVCREIDPCGEHVLSLPTDVSEPDDLAELVRRTVKYFGRIDVLVNNAGVDCCAHFADLSVSQIQKTIETNLTGAIVLTRMVIPHMLQKRRGCVVNMASTAGRHCPGYAGVYGATKAGLIGFTEGLRGEYLSRGITATAICPGFTKDGGIYDRMVRATGRRTSGVLGETTTKAVADAVMKAIRKAPPEIIVNWPPVRPALVLKQLFPRLGEQLAIAVSRSFTRRVANTTAANSERSRAA